MSKKGRNNTGSEFKNIKWNLLIFKELFKILNIRIGRFNHKTNPLKVNWEIFKDKISLFLKKLILFRFKSSVKNNRFLNFRLTTKDKSKGWKITLKITKISKNHLQRILVKIKSLSINFKDNFNLKGPWINLTKRDMKVKYLGSNKVLIK